MTFAEMTRRLYEDYLLHDGATFTVLATIPGRGIAVYTTALDDPRTTITAFQACLDHETPRGDQ